MFAEEAAEEGEADVVVAGDRVSNRSEIPKL